MAAGHDQGGMFQRFVHSEVSGSIVLLGATVAALVWANVDAWKDFYRQLVHTTLALTWDGENLISLSLDHWIGDGLMVIFFFVVGLEIKREVVIGQLSRRELAILPACAAFGGIIVPAAIYSVFNMGGPGASGWAIPMATDIAFALGILALFGKKVPIGLKVFLTALAIVDDLAAVIVIAVFYTAQIMWLGLAVAAIFLFLIHVAVRMKVRRTGIYIILCVGVWIGVLVSGVHATVAGVLLALLVPVQALVDPHELLGRVRRRVDELKGSDLTRRSMVDNPEQMEALDELYLAADDLRPPGLVLEHYLHPVQAFLILPLFALFKAGVEFGAETAGQAAEWVPLGIVLGLVVGKPIGVTGASWLTVKSGFASLPEGVTWRQIWGTSFLAGVGFTMSIFISELAFRGRPEIIGEAKIGVLLASVLAGVIGFIVLSGAFKASPGDQDESPGE